MEGEGGGRGKWEEMEGACGERRESVIYLFSTTFNCSKRILNNLFKIKNSMLEMSIYFPLFVILNQIYVIYK